MQVASYMRAVLRTLTQCHSNHILHRDVKPGELAITTVQQLEPSTLSVVSNVLLILQATLCC